MDKGVVTTSKSVKTPRMEIKTLVQQVCENSDKTLETLMQQGWEVLHISATSVVNPLARAYAPMVEHYEIVKLKRLVEEIDPEEDEVTEEVATVREIDVRPPLPIESSAVVTGTVLGIDAPTVDVGRKPLEEVTYTEALLSGRYNAEEIKQVANREAAQAGMKALWKSQQWGERRWDGLVNSLPTPRVIGDMVNL